MLMKNFMNGHFKSEWIKVVLSGVEKFLSRCPILGRAILFARPIGHAKMGAQNQSAGPIETKLETLLFALHYLNSTYSFNLLRGVPKNMLKVWDFTKNKLYHRYFDSHLQKMFRTNILKNGKGQIFLIVVLMVGLWLKF